MKEIIKFSLTKNYYIIGGILVAFCCVYMAWIFFPSNLSNDNIASIKEVKIPTKEKSPVVIQEPVKSKADTVLAPDYSMPPIANGLTPVVYKLPTEQKVVFLGIDDGAFKDQTVVDIMVENNIKASLFLSQNTISNNPDFFKKLVDLGSVVENHSVSHDTNMINTQVFDQQKSEICGMSDYVELHYGRRPTLFRPPGGAYSDSLRQAAADCGMKAVVTWIAKANGGSMQYQIGDKLRPGDIVLMHFRPEFAQDMKAFVDAMNTSGLHTALLEDAL
jgi:peptidoglycan/xylan/chitin deacetylase (PgdA/CDA1 family)